MRTLHITVSEFKIGVLLAYFVNWFVLHNISLMICSMDPCLVSSAGPNREDQIKDTNCGYYKEVEGTNAYGRRVLMEVNTGGCVSKE